MQQSPSQQAFPDTDGAPAGADGRIAPAAAVPAPQTGRRPGRRRVDDQDQKRQQARVRRLLIVDFFSALYLLQLLEFHLQGMLGRRMLAAIGTATGLALLVLHAVFAAGLNRNARDRNLTAPIALGALLIMLGGVYAAPDTKVVFVPFSFVVIAYGMYRLNRARLLTLTVLALGGYAVVIGLDWTRHRSPAALKLALLDWLALAIALPAFVLLAGRVRRLHNALYRAGMKIRNIEEHARRDPLIGCYNRRYMIAVLEEQKRVADESGQPLCLAVIDLDHFKNINDSVGHLAGDEVLRTFARIAQRNVRQEDVFGRYGGEEFLLVLPQTPLLAALNTAERIREQVERHDWQGRLQLPVTVSIGLTQYAGGESVLDLFARTDTAMYLAKRGGRNQVVVEERHEGLWRPDES